MSAKFASPLLGYNNNVRHKGRVFHIQTEDSGAKYGHVITHLFMYGGRILKSVKSSYAEHVGSERMSEVVRDLMKKQHKAMAVSLREGTFDRLAFGNGSASQETLALSSTVASTMRSTMPPASARAETIPVAASMAHASSPVAPSVVTSSARPSSRPPWRTSAIPTASPSGSERSRVARAAPEALDIGFPERAPSAVRPEGVPHRSSVDTPAAHLLRERTAMGTYRLTPRPMESVAASSAPPPVARTSISALGFATGGSQPAGASVRAVTTSRPASPFGQARPQGQSIFGEDLMSDKSLDEVILSYLAAELEGDKK